VRRGVAEFMLDIGIRSCEARSLCRHGEERSTDTSLVVGVESAEPDMSSKILVIKLRCGSRRSFFIFQVRLDSARKRARRAVTKFAGGE
jgi:hypothetical protein